MRNGYNGQILHVDLTAENWWAEELDDRIYRLYLGGSALSSYVLLRELRPSMDPLGPHNILVLMTSITNGLPLPGASRYSAAAKSPLTSGFGESEAGGYLGPELKRAGFDGVVIHGRAAKPVYLFIHDSTCEIRDGHKYMGQLADEVQEGLQEELGDRRICVLQTGIAGENLVRFAALTNQLKHFHGRCGLGAVMGSKNLKAIVARGGHRPTPFNSDDVSRLAKSVSEGYNPNSDTLHTLGTARLVRGLNTLGTLPTRNFREGSFELADAISGESMSERILSGKSTCFACHRACKREVDIPERGVVGKYGGMEYETIAAIGSLCGVGDLGAIAEASQWLNRYVLDSISTGAVIAFAMECYEHGILTRQDTEGIDLTWGNADAMIQMIHKIAFRQGLGDLLADGVQRAAASLGHGAEQFALHVKGQELPMHDPRGKPGVGLAYALSPTGADHLEAPHDGTFAMCDGFKHSLSPLGLFESMDTLSLGPEKVRAYYYTQMVFGLYNSLGMCIQIGAPWGPLPLATLRDFVNATTGWNMSLFELLKVGERANVMARVFNAREGFGVYDDRLPSRMFEPLQNGALSGTALDPVEFAHAIKTYYQMAGWDEQGVPTASKLAELDLTWAVASHD